MLSSERLDHSFIHVGFAHSGTKSLQLNFLSRRPDMLYCGIPYGQLGGIFSFIKYQDAASFDFAYVKQLCEDFIWKLNPTNKILVLSDENFVEQPEIYHTPAMMPTDVIARRLQDLFSPSKIIFTIRNQFEYVASSYLNLKRNFYQLSGRPIELFDDWFTGNHSQVSNLFLRNIDYSISIRTYMRVFGEESVDVFPLEELALKGATVYLTKIASYMKVTLHEADIIAYGRIRNARMTIAEDASIVENLERRKRATSADYARESSEIEANDGTPQSRPVKIILTDSQINTIRQRVSSGNRFIAEKFNLPLESYGYPIA